MALIEIETYRLRAGASEADFLRADTDRLTQFGYQRPGFIRATTARHADGRWLTLWNWYDAETADAAWATAGDDPACQRMAGLVEDRAVERFVTLE